MGKCDAATWDLLPLWCTECNSQLFRVVNYIHKRQKHTAFKCLKCGALMEIGQAIASTALNQESADILGKTRGTAYYTVDDFCKEYLKVRGFTVKKEEA